MTVYAIAQVSIHDRARYDRYAQAFMPVLMQYGGRLLAADEAPETVEGDWPHQKAVLLSFPDAAAFRAWAGSPEYRRISEDRLAGSRATVLLVRGIDAG